MSESYPIELAINTYKVLQLLDPPNGQGYVVFAYFVYKSPRQDGSPGKIICLGTYDTAPKAMLRVKEVIDKTGHKLVFAADTCKWEDLFPNEKLDRTKKRYIDVNSDKTDEELELQYQNDIEEWKEKEKKNKDLISDIEKQQILEKDENTVEHYAHNWFNCIKDKAEYEFYSQKAEHYKKEFEKRKENILSQYKKDPSVDNNWLSLYKQKLSERNENHVYDLIVKGYTELKTQILKDI